MPTPVIPTTRTRTDALAPGDVVATIGAGTLGGFVHRPALTPPVRPWSGVHWRAVEDVLRVPVDRATEPARLVWFTDGTRAESRDGHVWLVRAEG